MSEEELEIKKKKSIKDCFFSKQFIFFVFLFLASIIGIFLTIDISNILGFILMICIFYFIATIAGFFRIRSMIKKEYLYKNKIELPKWDPYIMKIDDFMEQCKIGFIYSYVEINNRIHILEVQIAEIDGPIDICYIDDLEFKNLEDFLNYKIDNTISLKELDSIKILETDGENPRQFF